VILRDAQWHRRPDGVRESSQVVQRRWVVHERLDAAALEMFPEGLASR
jgi:hypothetical protein